MAEWRIGRGWSDVELEERLERLNTLGRNFSDPADRLVPEHGWHRYFSEATVARERPGPPEKQGPFERGRTAVSNYEFSDPRIVIAHFDPAVPLRDRYILLELRALRILHYLGGVVVGAVRSERTAETTVYGFRYDTLDGHIERGAEWFLLTKEHASGAVRFRIEAAWQPGQFPNWWSRVGFAMLGKHYQEVWHRHAHRAIARLVRDPEATRPPPRRGRLAAPEVTFKRVEARHV